MEYVIANTIFVGIQPSGKQSKPKYKLKIKTLCQLFTERGREGGRDKTTVYFLRPPAPGKGRTLYIIISSIHI